MSVKLLTEHRWEFVSLKGGSCQNATLCRGSIYGFEPMRTIRWVLSYLKKRKNSDKYHKSSFSCKQCAVHARVHCNWGFFFMQTLEKETQLGNYVWCAKSVFVRHFPTACYTNLKTTTTRGLIVGFFDLKPCPWTITLSLCLRLILLAVPGPAPPPSPQRGCDKLI